MKRVATNRKEITFIVDENGCYNCTSHAKHHSGYHTIQRDGKDQMIHRYLFEQKYGKLPDGIVVRHKCDNRSCINLDHLESGTQQDNVNDMFERGRNASQDGENNGNVKLNWDIVRSIRSDKSSINVALSKKYGVTHQLISKIRKGYIWKE